MAPAVDTLPPFLSAAVAMSPLPGPAPPNQHAGLLTKRRRTCPVGVAEPAACPICLSNASIMPTDGPEGRGKERGWGARLRHLTRRPLVTRMAAERLPDQSVFPFVLPEASEAEDVVPLVSASDCHWAGASTGDGRGAGAMASKLTSPPSAGQVALVCWDLLCLEGELCTGKCEPWPIPAAPHALVYPLCTQLLRA